MVTAISGYLTLYFLRVDFDLFNLICLIFNTGFQSGNKIQKKLLIRWCSYDNELHITGNLNENQIQ